MKPAASRRWHLGDRFRYNRWAMGADNEPLEGAVFTITGLHHRTVYFRSDYDLPTQRDRKMSRDRFLGEVNRRLLVREP